MLPENQLEKFSREELLKVAQEHRISPTYAEKRLLNKLRGRRMLGLAFRFQCVYKSYIFDFYCPSLKVVIEVDYSSDLSQIAYFRERDAKLQSLGIKVFRYKNDEIMDHFNKVINDIQDHLFELALKKRKTKNGAQKQKNNTNFITAPSPLEEKSARSAGGIGSEMQVPRELKDLIIEQARYMSQHPTPAEGLLWGCLRKEQLAGYKFRRQHIIRNYIVDFYCPKRKLIVEVDGPIHQDQQDFDHSREINLYALGYKILRFTNDQVINQTDEVLKIIVGHLQ